MIAASMFDNLNKITKAEFHSFTLNVQTSREHESDIVFVQYQSSKRFLVQCKIFVLSSSNFYFLIIVFRLFCFSWDTFPTRRHDATLSMLIHYSNSWPVAIRKVFTGWEPGGLTDRSLVDVLSLAKQILAVRAKWEQFRSLGRPYAAFRLRWVKRAGNLELRLLCRSCEFLPLPVVVIDFIADQGKVLCFHDGLVIKSFKVF